MWYEVKLWSLLILGTILAIACGSILFAQVLKPIFINECNVFSRESGRNVKFVEYSWISYDCLTEQKNGHWISTSNLREEN